MTEVFQTPEPIFVSRVTLAVFVQAFKNPFPDFFQVFPGLSRCFPLLLKDILKCTLGIVFNRSSFKPVSELIEALLPIQESAEDLSVLFHKVYSELISSIQIKIRPFLFLILKTIDLQVSPDFFPGVQSP